MHRDINAIGASAAKFGRRINARDGCACVKAEHIYTHTHNGQKAKSGCGSSCTSQSFWQAIQYIESGFLWRLLLEQWSDPSCQVAIEHFRNGSHCHTLTFYVHIVRPGGGVKWISMKWAARNEVSLGGHDMRVLARHWMWCSGVVASQTQIIVSGLDDHVMEMLSNSAALVSLFSLFHKCKKHYWHQKCN